MGWEVGLGVGYVSIAFSALAYWPDSFCLSGVVSGRSLFSEQYHVIRAVAFKTQMSFYPDILTSFILCVHLASHP